MESLSNTKVLLLVIILLVLFSIFHERRISHIYGNSNGNHGMVTPLSFNANYQQSDSCLHREEDVENIISAADRIFIVTPPKAGGSSIKQFVMECTNNNFIQFPNGDFVKDKQLVEEWLTHDYELPKIVASHVYDDGPVKNLASSIPASSLLIYIHRNEEERLKSAIAYVVSKKVCGGNKPVSNKLRARMKMNTQDLFQDDGKCILEEDELIKLIRQKQHEIGGNGHKILKCGTYETFQNDGTNVLFMNYKQSDFLQETLAKYHCPGVEAIRANTASVNPNPDPYVRLNNDESVAEGEERRIVDLNSWLNEKVPVLGWTISKSLSSGDKCMGMTRQMERELLGCPTEFVRLPKFDL